MKKIKLILISAMVLMYTNSVYAKTTTIVDIAGRTVTVEQGSKHIILGEGRMVYSIAPLFGPKGNMFKHIIGMKNDLRKYDPDAYRKYLKVFPEISSIQEFGSPYKGDFDIEKAISIDAKIVIMNLGNLFKAKETGAIKKLNKVGIKVVFVDFRQQPISNTIPSLLIMGKVFDKEKESLAVVDFYVQQMQKVYARTVNKKESERPLVFIESAAAAGWGDCCSTFGNSNMGRFVSIAGGRNMGSKYFGGFKGKVSSETIFKDNPDIIIGTGANWAEAKPATKAVLLGYEAKQSDVNKRLTALSNRNGWETLSAVKTKRFHSIYHQFYNSPYNFVAIQQFAKWFYPNDFKDVDPRQTFVEFHDKFLPVSMSGIFWADLK